MRSLLAIGLVWASLTATGAPVFDLKDGTRVRGEIEGVRDGVYTVRSETLGRIEIHEQDIRRIDYAPDSADAATESANAKILSLQRDLAADGEIFAMIVKLQSDPELQAILADPEIMRAVRSGDLNALIGNEKFMKLLDNPNVRAITSRTAGRPETD